MADDEEGEWRTVGAATKSRRASPYGRSGPEQRRHRTPQGPRGNWEMASTTFECNRSQLSEFDYADPFNPGTRVAGIIVKGGPFSGSLLLTRVNDEELPRAIVIWGTPSIQYPYKGSNREFVVSVINCRQYQLSHKWNGVNVMFYKYEDAHGKVYVTAKPRSRPFLDDNQLFSHLSLTREALGLADNGRISIEALPPVLRRLSSPSVRAVSFELCGAKEPHLIRYDFPIALKELFVVCNDGRIIPVASPPQDEFEGLRPFVGTAELADHCRQSQAADLQKNEAHRAARGGLPAGYQYDHFAVEGKVLYVLDQSGALVDRNGMYKIKPPDCEEHHWEQFDRVLQGQVMEAVEKIYAKTPPAEAVGAVNAATLREELHMDPREWKRFALDIMQFVQDIPIPSVLQTLAAKNPSQRVLVMVGLPGSGKSTLAKRLAERGWVRVNQDEMGSRQVCERRMVEALQKGYSVVVDRCNYDYAQRKVWVQLAIQHGVGLVEAVLLDVPLEVCKERVYARTDHPTIPKGDSGFAIIDRFKGLMIPPTKAEGFVSITVVRNEQEADHWVDSLPPVTTPQLAAVVTTLSIEQP